MIALVESITEQYEIGMGQPNRVEQDCIELGKSIALAPLDSTIELLTRLLPLLQKRSGEIVWPLYNLLESQLMRIEDKWLIIRSLLCARDSDVVRKALVLAAQLVRSGALEIDTDIVEFLSEQVRIEASGLNRDDLLPQIAALIHHFEPDEAGEYEDPLAYLFETSAKISVRQLAARLLDFSNKPVPPERMKRVLGDDAYEFLSPYLIFTHAGHGDLIYLAPNPYKAPISIKSLRYIEETYGKEALRTIISELGWSRICLGIQAHDRVGISISGSLPLFVSLAEATLFKGFKDVRNIGEFLLIIAHGGLTATEQNVAHTDDSVTRFRSYNLTHAELLNEILDVAPLTPEKIRRIISCMDKIVEDFIRLFGAHTEECTILPGIYNDLKSRIHAEIENTKSGHQLSPELTRLTQMFEDPRSLGEVHTLHGLKRFLHQRGLKLGFRLVEAGRAPNCTVDVALLQDSQIVQTAQRIRYTDFDPTLGEAEQTIHMPYSVAIVAEGFARQLLHGHTNFPSVDIFCYGNEVHYYLAYRNHPAFVRIDFAPPLRGGMIDLEYIGVSNYELADHPNIHLDAIRTFFQKMEFDIDIQGTRIHARYDKERVLNLGDLCKKAEALFRLVPYLMDVDWVIGSLQLDADAKRSVTDAWAESFNLWGVLPIGRLLTENRLGIVERIDANSSGLREIAWLGEGEYRDRYSNPPPAEFLSNLSFTLESFGLDTLPILEEDCYRPMGQIRLEQRLFEPLEDALARGELVHTSNGICRQSAALFEREHEAEYFAEILASGVEKIAEAIAVARLITPLERMLDFQTTGFVGENVVQRACLSLRGRSLGLYVMRGPRGIIRLAMYARSDILCRHRDSESDPWTSTGSCDADELKQILFTNNYIARGQEPSMKGIIEEAEYILERSNPRLSARHPRRLPGQRIIHGLQASRGRAVGRVLFGTAGRKPEDFNDTILVAASVRPEDNTFLYHAAGIVSTGGGVLSHAGLIATQFHKPALIINGRWQQSKDGSSTLLYLTQEYRESDHEICGYQVCVRLDIHEREYRLIEGDLAVLDVDDGALYVLGQNHDVLALHDGFRQLAAVYLQLREMANDKEILAIRGRRLRAYHQIAKIVGRMTNPVLARHAVHELLLGEELSVQSGSRDDRIELLRLLISNPHIHSAVAEYLSWITQILEVRYRAFIERASNRIPVSSYTFEIVSLRLELIRISKIWDGACSMLKECGLTDLPSYDSAMHNIDEAVCKRLAQLRLEQMDSIYASGSTASDNTTLRHFLRRVERIDRILSIPESECDSMDALRIELSKDDSISIGKYSEEFLLADRLCGFELFPIIGWKAANLGEVGRIAGYELVPSWFVITDYAFNLVFNSSLADLGHDSAASSVGTGTLREAVDSILERPDLNNSQKSALIINLWESITLPPSLALKVAEQYRRVLEQTCGESETSHDPAAPMMALRSSTCEEDAEIAARAGEFETYLFIRGEQSIIEHLKRTWSSLWTERAIHNRAVLKIESSKIGGGVIVQRMVQSRVAGVLQTVNVASGELGEIVINVGLGLGEGIVAGIVEVDQITVSKEGDLLTDPLRFRYVTANKRKRVVYNQKSGYGTIIEDTLSHQRLRPALEYIELCELVRTAVRLENVYGYPLDIEFAIEGSRLWILQARPVATFLADLNKTIHQYPLFHK